MSIQKAYRFSRITPFSSYVNEFYNKKRILNKGGFRFIVKLLFAMGYMDILGVNQ